MYFVNKRGEIVEFSFPFLNESNTAQHSFFQENKTIKLLFSSLLRKENFFRSCFKNYLFWKLSIETKNGSVKSYSYKKTSNFLRRQEQVSEHAYNVYPSLSRPSLIYFQVFFYQCEGIYKRTKFSQHFEHSGKRSQCTDKINHQILLNYFS